MPALPGHGIRNVMAPPRPEGQRVPAACAKSPTGAHHWVLDGDEIGECKWCKDVRLFHRVEWAPMPTLSPAERKAVMAFGTRPTARAQRTLSTPVNDQDYQDKGCAVSPSCLACPLERCRYDHHPARSSVHRRTPVREPLRNAQ